MNCDFAPKKICRRTFLKGMGAVSAAAALAACGGAGSGSAGSSAAQGAGDEAQGSLYEIKDLVTYEVASRELITWNVFYSQDSVDFNVLTNCVDGLMSYDSYGRIVPALAESWEHNEDSSVWTFHLRKGVHWVDVNGNEQDEITARDFLTGVEWVLNQAKNEASNTSMPSQTVVGAAEYFAYTEQLAASDMAAAEALTYEDMLAHGVGVAAPDDYTLQVTCLFPCPYFDTVASYVCFYPAAPALVQQLGVEGFRACSPDTMWYCGPYIVDEFIMGNSKHYIPNPAYWNADCFRFDSVTVNMVQDLTMGYTLYDSGQLDEISLSESTLTTIVEDEGHKFHDYICEKRPNNRSYQMHLNYQKNNPDGTRDDNWNKAVANTAFRQCLHRGVDLTNFFVRTNLVNPLRCEANYYTMTGVCYNTQGVEYTELVKQKLWFANEQYDGETMLRMRGQDISALKAQAMEQLAAIGVTLPVQAAYYVLSGDQAALDTATVLKQCIADSLGNDMVQLDIRTYVSSFSQEVSRPRLQSIRIAGWGADYGDPVNFLTQENLDNPNAYYSNNLSGIALVAEEGWADWQADLRACYEEFTRLVSEASAIVDDIDARYDAFATAEAYFIEKALTVPCYISIVWGLTHVNEYSKIYAMYGMNNYKYVNWETKAEGYTTAEYEQIQAAHEAGV